MWRFGFISFGNQGFQVSKRICLVSFSGVDTVISLCTTVVQRFRVSVIHQQELSEYQAASLFLWLQMIRELSTVKVKESFIQRFNEPLKNASYPTSIVFKGLRKSRVKEECLFKTSYRILLSILSLYTVYRGYTYVGFTWVCVLCMRLCCNSKAALEGKEIE